MLGRLEKVPLRKVWSTESGQFTPWLAKEENIALLSEELEIDLEVIRQEEFVGPFKADILAKETTSDHFVIIENQFGKTDHSHLGQLLTYASGLDASTIIWISEKFTEEHRAALDWLNNVTNENVGFFGIEIELYKIGNSEPAPMFNVVCKPNNWSKTIKRKSNEAELTGTKILQQEYWETLKNLVENKKRSYRMQAPSPQHWTSVSIGRSGFHISILANMRDKWLCVQLVVSGNNALDNFRKLKEAFEEKAKTELSPDLAWLEKTGKEHHVNLLFSDLNPNEKNTWKIQHETLHEWIEKFHRFFSGRVKEI